MGVVLFYADLKKQENTFAYQSGSLEILYIFAVTKRANNQTRLTAPKLQQLKQEDVVIYCLLLFNIFQNI